MNTRMYLCVALLALAPAAARAQDAKEGQTYTMFQVEQEVTVKSGGRPVYPAALVAQRLRGEVLVQYVVDENGRPQMSSFKVLRTTNPLFADAVRKAVAGATYHPAEIAGKRVRQLVQQPFTFAVGS